MGGSECEMIQNIIAIRRGLPMLGALARKLNISRAMKVIPIPCLDDNCAYLLIDTKTSSGSIHA